MESKFEARNPNFETNPNVQNINDPNPVDCHCERSEAISGDCRVASLLAMTTFFCFARLPQAGISIFEFRVLF
jgi:hypothetical protein